MSFRYTKNSLLLEKDSNCPEDIGEDAKQSQTSLHVSRKHSSELGRLSQGQVK